MVPSGHMSPQLNSSMGQPGPHLSSQGGRLAMPGYLTTGRPSPHQPMTFTRALEVTKSLEGDKATTGKKQGTDPKRDENRDSVYDMNSYEISV